MSRAFGLKKGAACISCRFLTPGCRSDTGDGLKKPNPRETTMTLQGLISSPTVPIPGRFRLMVAAGAGPAPFPRAAEILRVGPLELDTVNRTVRRGERAAILLPRETRLLKYMMERCGQLLTRANLLEDVWNYTFFPVETNVVDVHLGRLRRKVDGPNEARMVRTVRGAGFILNATEHGAA